MAAQPLLPATAAERRYAFEAVAYLARKAEATRNGTAPKADARKRTGDHRPEYIKRLERYRAAA